jgi:hypothetical protein
MCDFFEERSEEVTDGVMARWYLKQTEIETRKQEENAYKAKIMFYTLEKVAIKKQRSVFATLIEKLELNHAAKMAKQSDEDRERRIVAEASLSALNFELMEALETISQHEIQEAKRIQVKKKNIQQKRQAQV